MHCKFASFSGLLVASLLLFSHTSSAQCAIPTPVATSNSQICPNTTLELFATDALNDVTYAWTGPNGFSSTEQNPVIPNATVGDAGTYIVTVTQGACTSDPAQTDVIITPIVIQISASKDSTCAGAPISVILNGTLQNNITYTWDFDTATVLSGSGTGPYSLQWDSAGIKTIVATASYNGCTVTDTEVIHVLPNMYLFPTIDKYICLDQLVTFGTTYNTAPPQGWTWSWSFGNDATVLNGTGTEGPYQVKWTAPGTKIIQLIFSGNVCLKATDDTIIVRDLPVAKISKTSSLNICTGDSVTFKADFQSGNIYTWTPATYFRGEQLNENAIGYIYQPGNVKLTVTDPYGCTNADSVNINAHVCCEMNFPSAFSPNGDGKNDVFRPLKYGHHTITSFTIENRWGQTIFSSDNEYNGWDGTFSGVPQDIGTYFWYVKYRCSDGTYTEKSGDVVLVK